MGQQVNETDSYPAHPNPASQRLAAMERVSSPTRETYVPHPHSPEGRVDRMEEQLMKLMESLSHFAQVGELTVLHADLQAQVAEFDQFRREVRAGNIHRQRSSGNPP